MSYKILIFDLDDTLIDNKESVHAAFKRMLEAQHLAYSEDDFAKWYMIDKKFWTDWQDDLVELPEEFKHETGKKSAAFLDWVRSQRVLIYFDRSISKERAIELNNLYMNSLHEVVVAVEGAQETLAYLSEKYKIVVATNGPQVATKQKLEKIGCLQYVTEVLSADMFGFMKPKVEFFHAIEEHYSDHATQDYLIIGDSLKSDIGFGMNAGIDSCWFNPKHEANNTTHTPTFTIGALRELIRIL